MARGYSKQQFTRNENPVNEQIRSSVLRVVGAEGENLGELDTKEAMKIAREAELDLIVISPKAKPPVAKIMDNGKFRYDLKKKEKARKASAQTVEVKSVQIKVGTDENDLNIKAKRINEWLGEGHRVKVELFLPGRTKYMDRDFLKERLERVLKLITVEYNIADPAKKNPKGLAMIIERKR